LERGYSGVLLMTHHLLLGFKKPIAIIENSSRKKYFLNFIQFSQYANIRGLENTDITMFVGVIGCRIMGLLAVSR